MIPTNTGGKLYEQATYSEGAFILENPAKSKDWDAAFLAGRLEIVPSEEKLTSNRTKTAGIQTF
jgi:hypothetical protein